jgi:glycosyltransferase involved in cell wall biosynthesis
VSDALVSIVLPTYNRAHLLASSIRSVLAQTRRNLELIVVDDNSSDATAEVVKSFDDPRLRYVRNRTNLKLPGALNAGFRLARGAFLTWTSDDNLYAPHAIARMVASLEDGNCDFVYADYFHFSRLDAKGEPVEPRRVSLPHSLRLEKTNSVGACFLYSRSVGDHIGPYDQELFLVEDYDYFIRIQSQGFRIRHIAEPLYYFSRHDDALFCSRFAEVQAAGVLVRYKNRLLDRESAVSECVRLVSRDMDAINNRVLRASHRALGRISWRLASGLASAVTAYMRLRIAAPAGRVLDGFTTHTMTFAQAKDALRELLQTFARLEYK